MRRNSQLNLPPMETTPVGRDAAARSTSVDQALELMRRAVADLGYTLDALAAETGKDRAYIGKVLNGDKPMSLEFIVSLPEDLEARFERLRAEQLGHIVVLPVDHETAVRQLVAGLIGVLAPKKAVA